MSALEAELKLPGALCALLVARGLADPEGAKAFLRPRLDDLHDPEALTDLPVAVDRILRALAAGETLFVHGDYDVDGMAGTALLTRWLQSLGGEVVPFIPHRLRDGYDLGPGGVEAALQAGARLLITVDCGILAHEAVEKAVAADLDVIVTDHHTPGDRLPPALAVLNPGREDCSYPNPGLCGAGVAFKLCQGLAAARGLPREDLYGFLDLVGLATIADLVPLRGENRILARYGLRAMARTSNPGLRALINQAGLDNRELSAGAVAFALAPRLNAVGRLGEPMAALKLLLTDHAGEAAELAREAEELNRTRQATDRQTLDEALRLLARDYDPETDFGLVLASRDWHPGVVGIVASRVTEQLHRPAILVAMDGDRGRGSGRSIPGFDLLKAIRECGHLLERFGGHRQAAGLEIRADRMEAFREAFNREAGAALRGQVLSPEIAPEVEIELAEVTADLHRYLKYMGPHGIGNPTPVFLARGVRLAREARIVGTHHLKMRFRQGGAELDGIGFQLARRISPAELGRGPLDVAFQIRENEYRGVVSLQAGLKDVRR